MAAGRCAPRTHRWASRAIGAVVVLAACREAPITVPIEALPGARSAVFAIERGPRPDTLAVVDVVATDLSTTAESSATLTLPRAVLDYETDESLRISVLGFIDPLADLGLTAGPLALTESEDARPLVELGPHAQLRQRSIDAGVLGAWIDADHLAPPLGDVRVDTGWPSGCSRLKRRRVSTHTATAASFALALDEDTALIGLEDQTLLRIEESGQWTDVTPAGLGLIPTWGALMESADTLWLSGREGLLWRVRIDREARIVDVLERHQLDAWVTTLETPPITRRPQFRYLGGQSSATSVEIFLLSIEGVLARFDGTTITELARFPVGRTDARAGLAYLGPGEAVAVHTVSPDLMLVTDRDQVRLIRLNDQQLAGVSGVGLIPGFGVLASDAVGNVFRSATGRTWERFTQIDNSFGADAFLAYHGGFFAGGPTGFLQQWRGDKARLCPPRTGLAHQTFRYLARLGDVVLATGTTSDEGDGLSVLLLDP